MHARYSYGQRPAWARFAAASPSDDTPCNLTVGQVAQMMTDMLTEAVKQMKGDGGASSDGGAPAPEEAAARALLAGRMGAPRVGGPRVVGRHQVIGVMTPEQARAYRASRGLR